MMQALMHSLHAVCVVLYVGTLSLLAVYGMHRYVQVFLYYRHMRKRPTPAGKWKDLPSVTVQLPMYNEQFVAERIITAAAQIDYPAHLLQIQVLDDSTDNSADIARMTCERLVREGHNVQYVQRTNRTGYKAGALENGLKTATGEFVLIFDADFVPPPQILRQTMDYFTDPNVGCVQTRWGHLNRDLSLLTRCQAVFLDGHFMVEHTARNRSGRFINFNGTAGIWRKRTIADSGGWQHDTLTEDVDLSYRAQVRGWRFVFLPELISPAELPPEMVSFKQQQHRWTKGSVQTARKLLPSILRAPLPLKVKAEAFFHLTSTAVYLPAVLLSLLLFPTFYLPSTLTSTLFSYKGVLAAVIASTFFGLLTCSAGTFYMVSQKAVGKSGFKTMLMVPCLMALGMGISLINAVAVLEGLFGRQDTEFVRTPKYGTGTVDAKEWKRRAGTFRKKLNFLPALEIGCGLYLAACAVAAMVTREALGTLPFLIIFGAGYLYVGVMTLYGRWVAARPAAAASVSATVPASKSVAA